MAQQVMIAPADEHNQKLVAYGTLVAWSPRALGSLRSGRPSHSSFGFLVWNGPTRGFLLNRHDRLRELGHLQWRKLPA